MCSLSAVENLTEFFSDQSPLAAHLPGFQPRPAQTWMAEAIAEAMSGSDRLIVEAGTGTGKTFAYLVPALLSGQKTIISTGTKALQDQLFHRDLPLVRKGIGQPVSASLLKGRANYLCLLRLDQVEMPHPNLLADLQAIREWRYRTSSGDKAELADVAEDSAIWPLVTSTSENCLGQKCPLYKECHVAAARKSAQEADLVVVNHHLLLADLAMKESGFAEFLPGADNIIIDEAHQLPELATQFFGVSFGTREMEVLSDELRVATVVHGDERLSQSITGLALAAKKLRAAAPRQEGRYPFDDLASTLTAPLQDIQTSLFDVQNGLEPFADASLELEKLYERLLLIIERHSYLLAEGSIDGLRWVQVNPRSLRLHVTPFDVSGTLSNLMSNSYQSWVLTSATLAVGDDFSHYLARIGLPDARALSFPSPFPIKDRSLLYLPENTPAPSSREHTPFVMDQVADLLEFTSGGAFVLFTSHRALRDAKAWTAEHPRRLAKRPLYVQGDAPRDELLRQFRDAGDGVLLGTGSFWEGIDVRGSALTIVAIDKLPFTSPADPLLMARLEYIRRKGGNGFMEHQVPQAALSLKQGAGRLLRDHDDYGVVMVCDPRITTKTYGRVFLKSLEPMPVTHSINDVAAFLVKSARAVA